MDEYVQYVLSDIRIRIMETELESELLAKYEHTYKDLDSGYFFAFSVHNRLCNRAFSMFICMVQ